MGQVTFLFKLNSSSLSPQGRCSRENCKYLHPPSHLKTQLEINGRNNLIQQKTAAAMLAQQMQFMIPGTSMQPVVSYSYSVVSNFQVAPDTHVLTPNSLQYFFLTLAHPAFHSLLFLWAKDLVRALDLAMLLTWPPWATGWGLSLRTCFPAPQSSSLAAPPSMSRTPRPPLPRPHRRCCAQTSWR